MKVRIKKLMENNSNNLQKKNCRLNKGKIKWNQKRVTVLKIIKKEKR